MAKQYLTNAINSSPTRAYPAAAAMQSIGGYAVKLNSNEKIVLCDTAGEMALGIVTIDNDHLVAADDSVSVQLKDIGKAQIGANVSAMDELAVNAAGKLVKATAGDYVVAVALGAYKSGTLGSVQLTRYKMPTE